MGEGEVDQISIAIGRLEAVGETLTDAVEKIRGALTDIVVTQHSHGERLDKIEPRVDTIHEHHTGRAAVWNFLKAVPYGVIGGAIPYAASYMKSLMH